MSFQVSAVLVVFIIPGILLTLFPASPLRHTIKYSKNYREGKGEILVMRLLGVCMVIFAVVLLYVKLSN